MLNQLYRLRAYECSVSSIISMIPKDMAACQEPTQSSSFIHQTHTYVLTLTPSSGFYLKIQHFEKSNTVASEIKLLRKLYVTVNLRFIALGSCSATVVALGFLAPAQY